jgi:hypothetical protein
MLKKVVHIVTTGFYRDKRAALCLISDFCVFQYHCSYSLFILARIGSEYVSGYISFHRVRRLTQQPRR